MEWFTSGRVNGRNGQYGNGLSKCDQLIAGRSDLIEVTLILINDTHYWLERVGGSMSYFNI